MGVKVFGELDRKDAVRWYGNLLLGLEAFCHWQH